MTEPGSCLPRCAWTPGHDGGREVLVDSPPERGGWHWYGADGHEFSNVQDESSCLRCGLDILDHARPRQG